jgi:peptidoglycan/xylan/chitin deacetylase (PgdA/CDA1 family)
MLCFWRGVRDELTRGQWQQIAVPGVPVLMYHSIAVQPRRDPYTVNPRRFAQQMWLLRLMRRRVVPLEKLVSDWSVGLPAARRVVALTFDDGYADNATSAWPVLRRYGYPATLFFVTGLAGQHNDWDVKRGRHRLPLLTWDEVRELDATGFRAQSHSVTHPDLRELPPEEMAAEIGNSRDHMGSELSPSATRLFAYPYGGRSQSVIAAARAAGYDAAFSARPGLNATHTNQWDRPRVAIHGTDGLLKFAAKVWFGADPARRLPRWRRKSR